MIEFTSKSLVFLMPDNFTNLLCTCRPHKKRMHAHAKENGPTEHRKRRRDEKDNFNLEKRRKHSNHENSRKGAFPLTARKNTRTFSKGPPSGGKKGMGQKKMGRQREAGVRKPAPASKFRKHKKFGSK